MNLWRNCTIAGEVQAPSSHTGILYVLGRTALRYHSENLCSGHDEDLRSSHSAKRPASSPLTYDVGTQLSLCA